MRQVPLLLVAAVFLAGAPVVAGEFRPSEGNPVPQAASSDPTYGYTEGNPIKVGRQRGGPGAEEAYLRSIAGPAGERVKYKRLGSCCEFETPNGLAGLGGLLDVYEVQYRGIEKPVNLYLNMYDYEQPLVPMGLSVAQ